MKTKTIFNEFYNRLKTLESTSVITTVTKTGVDAITEGDYPAVEVVIGSDNREELDKLQYEHALAIYTDIHVTSLQKDIDEKMLDIRELVEDQIFASNNLGLAEVFNIKFIGQSEPSYNQPATEYASMARLEWQVIFFTEREIK